MNYLLKRLLSFFILLAVACSAAGQTKTERMKAIREEFRAINDDSTLKMVQLQNEEFMDEVTDGGGELTGYYKNGKIRKIRQWIGLSNGNEVKEYYFKNAKLIFVYEQFHSFPYDLEKDRLDRTTTTITFEARYYFSNNQLIEKKATGERQPAPRGDAAKILLAEAGENIKLLERGL